MKSFVVACTVVRRRSFPLFAAALVLAFNGSLAAQAGQTAIPAQTQLASAAAPPPASASAPDHLELSGAAYCGPAPASNQPQQPCRLGDTLFVGFRWRRACTSSRGCGLRVH